MTNYEIWFDSGETVTVEANVVDWDDVSMISFYKDTSLVALAPICQVKVIRLKPDDSSR